LKIKLLHKDNYLWYPVCTKCNLFVAGVCVKTESKLPEEIKLLTYSRGERGEGSWGGAMFVFQALTQAVVSDVLWFSSVCPHKCLNL